MARGEGSRALPLNEAALPLGVSSLSPRGTSGERAGERGIQVKTALLSPTLSSLCGEERENSSLHRRFYSLIQWQCPGSLSPRLSRFRCNNAGRGQGEGSC